MEKAKNQRKKKDYIKLTRKLLHREIKRHPAKFTVYVVLRVLVIAVGVLSFFNGNYQNMLLCLLSLVLFMLPSFVERNFGIDLPDTLEIIVLLFIFAAEILGEISSFYEMVVFWDSMLHTINGFLCAAIGFALVDVLNRSNRFRFQLSPLFLAVVAFCFSMTVGVLWEFFEFGMDSLFSLDMQKDFVVSNISSVSLNPAGTNEVMTIKDIVNTVVTTTDGTAYSFSDYGVNGYLDIGIIDTMKDLFVNFIGAVCFSVIGYFYVKSRGRGKFASQFIPTLRVRKNGEEDI